VGITAGSREVPGRNACDKRHPYRIIIIIIIIIISTRNVGPEVYDYINSNWSHWNSNEKLKEKLGK